MYSMTGFANLNKKVKEVVWDLKIMSVNNKFLELKIDGIKDLYLYDVAKNIIQEEITRGKIYIQCNYEFLNDHKKKFKLDENIIKTYYSEIKRVSEILKIKNDVSLIDLIKISSFNSSEMQQKIDEKDFISSIKELLVKLKANRKKEGDKLKKKFLSYIKKLELNATSLKKIKKDNEVYLREKIKTKLKDLSKHDIPEIERKNIEREIDFILLKGDVEEEIVRLNTHLKEFKKILDLDEPIGKKIGFLVQELHREFNTLGDKIVTVRGKQIAIDSKILVDRIREQGLNIE